MDWITIWGIRGPCYWAKLPMSVWRILLTTHLEGHLNSKRYGLQQMMTGGLTIRRECFPAVIVQRLPRTMQTTGEIITEKRGPGGKFCPVVRIIVPIQPMKAKPGSGGVI